MKYRELQFHPPMLNVNKKWDMITMDIPGDRMNSGFTRTVGGCRFPETMSQNDAIREYVKLLQEEVDEKYRDRQKDIEAIKSFITSEG